MHDSECGRVFALLQEYLDRELPPASCEELEAHLQGCPECIQFIDSLKRSVKLCHQFANSEPVPQVDEQVIMRLRSVYQAALARRRMAGSAQAGPAGQNRSDDGKGNTA